MFQSQPFPLEDALPPEEVRFTDVHIEPWPDGHRVRVHVSITPFQKKPNLEAHILDKDQGEVSSVIIIENMDIKLVFTMHLRGSDIKGPFTLVADLMYEDLGIVDEFKVPFEIEGTPPAES